MLGPGWLGVAAVGGAVRNSSGHWRVECRQAELGHYRLELRPGYQHQHADCLVCTGLAGGPLIMRTAALASLAPQLPRALAPLDLALRGGGAALACPDIMFFTRGSLGQELDTVTREEWRHLAARHQLQGVSTQFRREMEAEFSCEEVDTLVTSLPWLLSSPCQGRAGVRGLEPGRGLPAAVVLRPRLPPRPRHAGGRHRQPRTRLPAEGGLGARRGQARQLHPLGHRHRRGLPLRAPPPLPPRRPRAPAADRGGAAAVQLPARHVQRGGGRHVPHAARQVFISYSCLFGEKYLQNTKYQAV